MSYEDDSRLNIGLIPASAWGRNVRAIVSEESWLRLRKKNGAIYDPYNNYPNEALPLVCECCERLFFESLHLHELWTFDDDRCTQTLVGFKVICEDCHNAIHIGRANKVGLGEGARNHLKWVNEWSDRKLNKHIENAFNEWNRRHGNEYEIDVNWLLDQQLLTAKEIHLNWLNRPGRVYDRIDAIGWAKDILSLQDVIILDTETTGLIEGFNRYPEAEIIELAIISTSGDVLYNNRFKPLYTIPKRAMKIHGITNTMVKRSPCFAKEFPIIMEILHGKIAVSYNTRFDSKILNNTCKLHEIKPPDSITWECAMRVFKAYLEPAISFVKLPNASHSALGDCRAALDLINKMSKGEEIIVDA